MFNIGRECSRRLPVTKVKMFGAQVEFVIDSGSTMNIIDLDSFNKLANKPTLDKPISNAYRFDSKKPINFHGRFTTIVESGHAAITATVHVLKYASSSPNLLSFGTAEDLGLIRIIKSVENLQDKLKDDMIVRYPSLFSGKIGCLKDYKHGTNYMDISMPHRAQKGFVTG